MRVNYPPLSPLPEGGEASLLPQWGRNEEGEN
jgi:hypothetical protein